MAPGRIEDKLLRIQGEYLEMPGLCLTPAQAQRLWGLERTECESLMAVLVQAQFLARTRDGSYVRVDPNSASRGGYPETAAAASRVQPGPYRRPTVLAKL